MGLIEEKDKESENITILSRESCGQYLKKTRQRGGSQPDKGWAWIVLLAAFMCNVIFDGIIFSFGILYIELLDFFKDSGGMTSWIGSVISGVYACVGRYSPFNPLPTVP